MTDMPLLVAEGAVMRPRIPTGMPRPQVEAKRKEIAEAEKAAAATQARLSDLRSNEKECASVLMLITI